MSTQNKSKNILYILIGVLLAGSISYRLISNQDLEKTSILFIGLPTILSILILRFVSTPKTAYGVVFLVITLFFLVSAILLGEGFVCILYAAPIFYGVGAIVAFIIEFFRKRNKNNLNLLGLIPAILLLAQPSDFFHKRDLQTVTRSIIVDNQATLENINNEVNLSNSLPYLFKLGFPKPAGVMGSGLTAGDTRDIQFMSNTKGIGTLSIAVISNDENKIVFDVTKDNTHINHWLTWKRFEVKKDKISESKIKISWTSQFECDLGPTWYFEPLERHAVGLMNLHLLQSFFATQE